MKKLVCMLFGHSPKMVITESKRELNHGSFITLYKNSDYQIVCTNCGCKISKAF